MKRVFRHETGSDGVYTSLWQQFIFLSIKNLFTMYILGDRAVFLTKYTERIIERRPLSSEKPAHRQGGGNGFVKFPMVTVALWGETPSDSKEGGLPHPRPVEEPHL